MPPIKLFMKEILYIANITRVCGNVWCIIKQTQILKLTVDALKYVIYSNMSPYTWAFWAKSVDTTQILLIFVAEYYTLIEECFRFEL